MRTYNFSRRGQTVGMCDKCTGEQNIAVTGNDFPGVPVGSRVPRPFISWVILFWLLKAAWAIDSIMNSVEGKRDSDGVSSIEKSGSTFE